MHNIVAQYSQCIIVSSEVLTQWFVFTVYFIIIIVLYYRYTITIITIIYRCERSLSFYCMFVHHCLCLTTAGCSTSTVVGLSLGIVTAYLLGLGTASAVAVIIWLCVRKRSGWYYSLHVLQLVIHCRWY